MKPGNVVVLNGTSSAGKSTTARALQQIMETPYVHTGVDHFLPRVSPQFFTVSEGFNPSSTDYFQLVYRGGAEPRVADVEGGQTVFGLGEFTGFHIGSAGMDVMRGIYCGMAAMAEAGVNVIVDDVIHDERLLRASVDAFSGLPVLFVGLHLPRDVAVRRERERGDRGPGGSAAFYDLVHAHKVYDMELDTSALSPEECALLIKEALQNERRRHAFDELRDRFSQANSRDGHEY